ncbi:MAG: hypothetical protein A4E73_02434 [Syntrophaceae bacterium PtaU1.Bin231]|nr:MAG: hypothetical protein A4E73_02434 [Syntrophaceae bacterium PtaU1.Bin231]
MRAYQLVVRNAIGIGRKMQKPGTVIAEGAIRIPGADMGKVMAWISAGYVEIVYPEERKPTEVSNAKK